MSKIALSGNASGTGTLTISAPNTSTDRTLTLPDQTATLITNSSGVLDIGSGQLYKDASGNVGIGTSSPAEKLEVAGMIRLSTNPSNPSTNDASIYNASGIGPTISGNAISFRTQLAERARIDSSGNLLVNQTSQIGAEKTGISFDRTSQWGLAIKNTSSTSPSNATYVSFYYTSTNTGSINSTGTTTSYGTTSDYRLKENVAPMTGALATVAQLNPVTYTWKADGSDGQGFIAHELAEVVPDCVTGEKDAVDADGNPQYQGIDTSFLVATLTAAIQELKAIVDAQGAEIAALKGIA